MNPRCTHLWRPLIVTAEAPIPDQPGEGAFDHPAPRQHHEACRPGHATYDFDHKVACHHRPHRQIVTPIRTVRPDQLQTGETLFRLAQNLLGSILILDIGRVHYYRDEQPQSVHHQMTLAAGDFLAGVVAATDAAFAALDTLAVHNARGRLGPSAGLLADAAMQSRLQLFPDAGPAPAVVLGRHRPPRGEIVRQHAPLTAGAQDVEDGVEDGSVVHRGWTACLASTPSAQIRPEK